MTAGLCRNEACSLAAEANPVERYPGPGEYCPQCGERLEPLSLREPAGNRHRRGRLRAAVLVMIALLSGTAAAALHEVHRPSTARHAVAASRVASPAPVAPSASSGDSRLALLRTEWRAQPRRGDGTREDMRLGAFAMTAAQMLEHPMLAIEPKNRAFLRDVTLQLASLQPSAARATRAREIAKRLSALSSAEEVTVLRALWRDEVFYTASPRHDRRAFLFGIDAVQIAYVADGHHDLRARDDDLSALGSLNEFDAVSPQLAHARRATLQARNDWPALNEAATKLVLLIIE